MKNCRPRKEEKTRHGISRDAPSCSLGTSEGCGLGVHSLPPWPSLPHHHQRHRSGPWLPLPAFSAPLLCCSLSEQGKGKLGGERPGLGPFVYLPVSVCSPALLPLPSPPPCRHLALRHRTLRRRPVPTRHRSAQDRWRLTRRVRALPGGRRRAGLTMRPV
jgi:hypothetical protein